ncbi:hypothetical protein GCM10010172_52310 [Paractinoplanes ferrugineus]|uniref:licheninase n=1 Tax=Paractinoplanes ferrugineus TaxID=113564 RepID=A0A919IZZ7_9ACTN|nr:glycoside hydrolase family 16 protein [Actinoplanes ferrugineus]GIE11950.1 hypothetical protein Afe05nite_37900 [Actinoplanes ferrugineus]
MIIFLAATGAHYFWPNESPSMQFKDEFDSMDAALWTAGKRHPLGRSVMDPANVEVRGGELRLRMPGGTLGGAEMKTVTPVGAGVFEARMKLADAPTSVTGLFLYAPPDLAHEIDIELFNQPAGRIRFSTYADGALTHTSEQALPFDPTADFHLYGIAQTRTGVEFYVDDELVQAWDDGVPRERMNLYLNTWYPQWLAGTPASTMRYTAVDFATYRANPAG